MKSRSFGSGRVRRPAAALVAAVLAASCGGGSDSGGGPTGPPNVSPPGVPASVAIVSGDRQTGPAGRPLDASPTVRVVDGQGDPVADVQVSFTPTPGSGTVTRPTETTDQDGVATAGSWTLGPDPGTQQIRATVTGATTAFFVATAEVPPAIYDIVVRFNAGTPTTAQRRAFLVAETRWQGAIVGEVADLMVTQSAGFCGSTDPLSEVIDDIVILVDIVPIDGAGGILGSAGPCLIRGQSLLPVLGRMRFDSADLLQLESSGRLDEVIVHEMGHVLGIGGLWDDHGLVAEVSGAAADDPHFTGAQARAAFDAVGGAPHLGKKVPIADTGGGGTRFVHWRERVMGNELMTGFIDDGANPISAVTIASLGDMGYTIDLDAAEEYTVPFSGSVVSRNGLWLGDDVLREPVYVAGPDGKIEVWRDQ